MNNQLRFKLDLKDHPYLIEYQGAIFEAWGEMSITLSQDNQSIVLLEMEWNLDELAVWYVESRRSLCGERLSIEGNVPLPQESLAQALHRLQERDFLEQEGDAELRWGTQIYEFRNRHDLRFAFRGTNIPGIVIGLNHGYGEISLRKADGTEWAYQFDMDDFCEHLRQELRRFLGERRSRVSDPKVLEYASDLIAKLEQAHLGNANSNA